MQTASASILIRIWKYFDANIKSKPLFSSLCLSSIFLSFTPRFADRFLHVLVCGRVCWCAHSICQRDEHKHENYDNVMEKKRYSISIVLCRCRFENVSPDASNQLGIWISLFVQMFFSLLCFGFFFVTR